jgi:hypothetical protein
MHPPYETSRCCIYVWDAQKRGRFRSGYDGERRNILVKAKIFRVGGHAQAQPTSRPGFLWRAIARLLVVLLPLVTLPPAVSGYSFMTHQNMVDVAWQNSIVPAIRARFPTVTAAQLREARAYAYGGATIQDMGYYPFGHEFFSDLTHYVRSGEFIENLLLDSETVDEYAFAIGALSHYISTPLEFPKLGKKYGPRVTYDEAPYAHIRTEFAYDVEQARLNRMAPRGYIEQVHLYVPLRLLKQAFAQTYGLSLRSVLGPTRTAIESYRSSLTGILPDVAHAETLLHRTGFPPEDNTPAFAQYHARQAAVERENNWKAMRRPLGVKIHVLAGLIWLTPKVGPLSTLAIRGPSAQTNRWYIESRNRSAARYAHLLARLQRHPRAALTLPNRDLDTGDLVRPGGYTLTDKTYAKLLGRVTKSPDHPVPAGLKRDVLAYYADPDAPIVTKKHPRAWRRVQRELTTLRGMRGIPNCAAACVAAPERVPGF